jgi:hypothetical protein
MVAVVGPTDQAREQLRDVVPVEVARAASSGPAAQATAADSAKGRESVKRALLAHGGANRLRSVRDSRLEADAAVLIGMARIPVHLQVLRQEPDRMMVVSNREGTGRREVLEGTRAWSAPLDSAEAIRDADSASVASMRWEFRSDIVHVLLDAADPGTHAIARGAEGFNGQPANKVELWTRGGAHRWLYVDPANGLLVGVVDELPGGMDRLSRRGYRDYRAVSGMQMPFAEDRWLGDRHVMELTYTGITINGGVEGTPLEHARPSLPRTSR